MRQVVERRLQPRRDMTNNNKQYVLVIKNKRLAFGPFSLDDAEYAAQAYYGTAITGADSKEEFLIVELRAGDSEAIDRERDRHVAALLASDV